MKMITKQYIVSGKTKEQLLMIESLFEWISYLCRIGSSRELRIFVDGDGDLSIDIKSLNDELVKWSDGFNKGYGVIKLDNNKEPYYWDLG